MAHKDHHTAPGKLPYRKNEGRNDHHSAYSEHNGESCADGHSRKLNYREALLKSYILLAKKEHTDNVDLVTGEQALYDIVICARTGSYVDRGCCIYGKI